MLKGGGLAKSPQGNGNSKNNELASGIISQDDKNKNKKLWLSIKLLVPQPVVTGTLSVSSLDQSNINFFDCSAPSQYLPVWSYVRFALGLSIYSHLYFGPL